MISTVNLYLNKDFYQVQFKFDNILKQDNSQSDLYSTVSYIVTYFLVGVNGTIFAYGQTGAGKTYSVIGEDCTLKDSNRGVLPRAIHHIFHAKNENYN